MGSLYDIAQQVHRELERTYEGDAIGLVRAKGTLAARTGFLISLITPSDPDDPAKAHAIRQAAKELGIAV